MTAQVMDNVIYSNVTYISVKGYCNRNEYQEYFLWGKGGRCVWLTTLPSYCADCLEIWEPQPPGNPQGLSRPVMGLLYLYNHERKYFLCHLQLLYTCIFCQLRCWGCLSLTNIDSLNFRSRQGYCSVCIDQGKQWLQKYLFCIVTIPLSNLYSTQTKIQPQFLFFPHFTF